MPLRNRVSEEDGKRAMTATYLVDGGTARTESDPRKRKGRGQIPIPYEEVEELKGFGSQNNDT